MNVNCANNGGRSLNITNMNLFIRLNKTREIFPSVTRVLSILLTISAISSSVEMEDQFKRACSLMFLVGVQVPAMPRGQLFATITWLMSKCL